MKKKSPRGIPDFSRKKPQAGDGQSAEPSGKEPIRPRRTPPPVRAKPQSTSAKSGQRGQ